MTVLFAASEVGSARAVLPVASACRDAAMDIRVLDRGFLGKEVPKDWGALVACGETPQAIDEMLLAENIRTVVFSSNIHDPLPESIARRASLKSIPTIHVLDFWNGYSARLTHGGEMLRPDVYAVPDDLAAEAARREGIDPDSIVITGQPNFSDIAGHAINDDAHERGSMRRRHGFEVGASLLLFVSEPVVLDQGDDPEAESYRGYTERTVLKVLADALALVGTSVQVGVLAHPREDREALQQYLETLGTAAPIRLLEEVRGRDALAMASGVVGMSSTLLYESWLLGLPVLSLQPELRYESLRYLEHRDEVLFLTAPETMAASAARWVHRLADFPACTVRQEAMQHVHAAEQLYSIVNRCLSGTMPKETL